MDGSMRLESSHYMDESDESTAYFLMPDKSLKGLKEELEIIMGEDSSADLLYRLGYRSGEGAAKDTAVDPTDFKTLEKFKEELPEHWIHIGLSSIEVLKGGLEDFYVSLSDTIEAKLMRPSDHPSCNFTKGFLEGVISVLFDKKYTAEEKECIAEGNDHCIFHVFVDKQALTPDSEDMVRTKKRYDLRKGAAYRVDSDNTDKGIILFKDQVTHGHQGLLITRTFPTMVQDSHGLKKTPMLWLSNERTEDVPSIKPGQLGLLHHKIEQFFKKSEDAIVFLDGIEYLITQNSFSSVLKVIQLLKDKVARYRTNLVIPLSPHAFEKKNFSLIARELVLFTHPELQEKGTDRRDEEKRKKKSKEKREEKKRGGKLSAFSKMIR